MHRFYVENPCATGQRVILSPEESQHAAKVLRLKPGQEVQLLDGNHLWQAVLETVDAKGTTAQVKEALPSPEASCQVTLLQGLPKADKLEWIAQKGTELGLWQLWPVAMERSVRRSEGKEDKKTERLQRISLEAAKQSGRAHVPQIYPCVPFPKALQRLQQENFDLVLVAWEEEHVLSLSATVQSHLAAGKALQRLCLVIGPEGGIIQQEVQQLKALGALPVTLGRRILRTETAGLAALAGLWALLGEM